MDEKPQHIDYNKLRIEGIRIKSWLIGYNEPKTIFIRMNVIKTVDLQYVLEKKVSWGTKSKSKLLFISFYFWIINLSFLYKKKLKYKLNKPFYTR